ncbi:MAG: DUF1559 domain-containing protein [Planctomycetes bacterium]|nr:DUF1559 domain-containing protein [Planctomycetota bacterium]
MYALRKGFMMLPTVGSGPVARTSHCRFELRSIGRALGQYHADYGCYPPAVVTDEDGKLLHSWRTLRLSDLDQGSLYKRVDLSARWDSPRNREFTSALRFILEKNDWTMACPFSVPFAIRRQISHSLRNSQS